MLKVLSIKVDEGVEKTIKEIAETEGAGKSPTARKLLEMGILQWKLSRAMDEVTSGRTSVWRASEKAGISLREFLGMLKDKRISWVRMSPSDVEEEIRRTKGVQ